MSTNQLPEEKRRVATTGKPLQRLSWSEKISKKYDWFKQNVDYRMGLSNFNQGASSTQRKDLGMLYSVYNNQFPMEWFAHITDPLSASDPQHKVYPAKVRPTSMLRTNIDLLLGEYPKRPYIFQVMNMGEDAYNTYLDGLNKKLQENIQEHFLQAAQANMQAAGHDVPQVPQQQPQGQDIPMPEEIKDRFNANYKDNLAIRGQKVIKRMIREHSVRNKQLKMFKDWLITGRAYSYKNIENGNFVYERVSPLELDFDKSPGIDLVEDGEWAIRKKLMTISDVVDSYYDELKEKDYQSLESSNWLSTPFNMFTSLQGISNPDLHGGKIPVYHLVWKGMKEVVYVNYTDPFTGQMQEMVLDENVPIDDTMKVTKRQWLSEIYEATCLGDGIYVNMRAIPVQRNEMNNFSKCKLPYNGKHYSDTHAENISVLEMGLPYGIMYMVTNFILEKTIAKSKGKIALIDQNAIPKKDGWTEEKFFYYADALGYMLVNRNQMGVDKSFNQYSTLDMSLFGDIEKLIQLRDSFKADWDGLLGITPQRKAEIAPSAGLGTTQASLFQSSLMTDMIYTLFEEFTESEGQGMLDYSKFVNVDGIRAIYNEDDFDKELLEIDPNSYCSAEMGIFFTSASEEDETLKAYKQQTQAMIQNGVKQSTILEIQRSNNVAELLAKMKEVEAIEAQQAQAQEESAHDKEMAMEQVKQKFMELQSQFKINEINAEWDRKDQNTALTGEYELEALGISSDADGNGVPDSVDITKRVLAGQKILADERHTAMEINSREKINNQHMKSAEADRALEKEKLKSKEKTEKMKASAARARHK